MQWGTNSPWAPHLGHESSIDGILFLNFILIGSPWWISLHINNLILWGILIDQMDLQSILFCMNARYASIGGWKKVKATLYPDATEYLPQLHKEQITISSALAGVINRIWSITVEGNFSYSNPIFHEPFSVSKYCARYILCHDPTQVMSMHKGLLSLASLTRPHNTHLNHWDLGTQQHTSYIHMIITYTYSIKIQNFSY